MLVEDQSLDLRVLVEDLGRFLGEIEARHDVAHEAHAAVVNLFAQIPAVRLIDDAEHGGGMGVVDEGVRDERVQQRFDRRIGRHRIDQVGALHPTMSSSDKASRARSFRRFFKSDSGQAGGLDMAHVPA